VRRRIGILYLASFLGCCVPYVSSAQERAELHQFPVSLAQHRRAPDSTPPGVTVIDVFGFDGRFLWRYVATNHGKPLYTVDVGIDPAQAPCDGACTNEFVPYLATSEVKPTGDWSLVMSSSNHRQWAYKRHPLYYLNGDDPVPPNPNAGLSFNVTDSPYKFDKRMLDPGSDFFSPAKGWRRAEFVVDGASIPAGIKLKSLAVAGGYAFADASTGMPLYLLATSPKNPRVWTPMYAAGLAGTVGDFSIVFTKSGRKQWSYQGGLLYSYRGDYSSDDLNGLLEQKDAQVAMAVRNFMPSSVQIKSVPFRGPIMMTRQGKTLYTQAIGGGARGIERRGDSGPAYAAGKALGTKGCVDECLKTWQPLPATAKDQASGYWEVLDRPDGSKQWAYRGSALYTYAGDKQEGDVEGNGQRVIVYGDKYGKNFDKVSLAGGNRGPNVRVFAGSGFHWARVALSE
jgi:predicted lipoprotein with Yx(FWY)xxD motif